MGCWQLWNDMYGKLLLQQFFYCYKTVEKSAKACYNEDDPEMSGYIAIRLYERLGVYEFRQICRRI